MEYLKLTWPRSQLKTTLNTYLLLLLGSLSLDRSAFSSVLLEVAFFSVVDFSEGLEVLDLTSSVFFDELDSLNLEESDVLLGPLLVDLKLSWYIP